MVLEKFVVTVVVSEDWGYCRKVEYTLYASNQREAEQHAYREYGKANVESIEKA